MKLVIGIVSLHARSHACIHAVRYVRLKPGHQRHLPGISRSSFSLVSHNINHVYIDLAVTYRHDRLPKPIVSVFLNNL